MARWLNCFTQGWSKKCLILVFSRMPPWRVTTSGFGWQRSENWSRIKGKFFFLFLTKKSFGYTSLLNPTFITIVTLHQNLKLLRRKKCLVKLFHLANTICGKTTSLFISPNSQTLRVLVLKMEQELTWKLSISNPSWLMFDSTRKPFYIFEWN